MRVQSTLALLLFLAGCATSQAFETTADAPPLPTADEVSRYVHLHWSDVSKTFARFSQRPGASAELIGVSEVVCCYTYTTPECRYQVTGRFGDGASAQKRLFSQFDRDEAGNLVEVIVMWHERRR
jgi:hypothetical protein